MAISSSPDWSLPPNSLGTSTKVQKCTFLLPSWKPGRTYFVSAPFSVHSSSLPSPILDTHLDLDHSQQFLIENPDGIKLNNTLLELFEDPLNQETAYEFYEKAKQRAEFRPEKPMLKLLIRYLVKSKKWDLIMSLTDDFKHYCVFPDGYTCSKLINSCIRARKFRIVKALLQVLKSDAELAVLAFDSVMEGYNKLHMSRSTLAVYEEMKSGGIIPDLGCYCRVMEAYQKLSDTENVVAIFNEVESKKLLDTSSPKLSNWLFGILCESLRKSGRAYEALQFFRYMKMRGIMGNSFMYSSLICAFAVIRDVKVTEELFKEAREKGMIQDPWAFMNLVVMYVEEGLLEKTLDVVWAMQAANVKVSDCIFCAIVNGFSKKRGLEAAIKVYEELIMEGCIPGQVTYASIINVYCRSNLCAKAEMTFLEMLRKGFDKCVVAYSNMVAMYGKTGRVRDAMRLVAKMKQKGCEPNVWVYNTLMDMHGRVKNLRQVEKLWREMKRRNLAPDNVSYTTIISAYNKAKEYELCVKFYREFRTNGRVIDNAMAGIMVGVFSKTGQLDEIVTLLQDMKAKEMQLDQRLYSSALFALMDAGMVRQVKWLQKNFDSRMLEVNQRKLRKRAFAPRLEIP
ncbi:hypothetical protein SLEP1_g24357 [Rubroshorea leprosula]|uniref:Pentatricopeptide repeat-containing protein n=1 Tax=Rubroshorea leprosula TaxID=152421 RepID=A0AAV5JPN2_9ROSI|nr:hypothetical protein SLEP1_g24357 [Rubroshorea leprosula]